MYSHSKKWVSSEQKQRNKIKAGNKTRNRMFPKSCAWTADYDLDAHHEAMAKLRRDRHCEQVVNAAAERRLLEQQRLGPPPPIKAPMRAAYVNPSGAFSTNHSTVLALPTVFVPSFDKTHRSVAPWPCKEELFHEGDYRISNEKHLRRMLPAPRISCDDSVAWSKRMYLQPQPMDDFRVFRNGMGQTAEVSEEEGVSMLGADLLYRLNPVGRL